MSDAECRYSVTDQEWLAVVDAVTRHWRHLLKGNQVFIEDRSQPSEAITADKRRGLFKSTNEVV